MSRRGVIGVVLTLLLVSQAAWGIDPNYYVSPDGNDAWNGEYPTYQGGLDGPKATVQAGIDVAGSGSEGNYKIINVLNNNGEAYTYDVNETILLNQHSYQEIIFYENVVAKGGRYFDTEEVTLRPLFNVRAVNNIRFTGYEGATFRMTKRPGHMTYNGCHAIRLDGVNDVEILGLNIEKSRGDGIYIGRGPGADVYCENIEIRGVDCNDNSRNAITVISVDGLTIDSCILRNTSGATLGPCAGIDFEPFRPWFQLTQILVRNTRIENNEKKGIMLGLGKFSTYDYNDLEPNDLVPLDMLLENIYVTGPGGIIVYGPYQYGPLGSIEFRNVTVEDANYGLTIQKSSLRAGLSFVNCVWKNVGSTDPYGYEVCPISVYNAFGGDKPVGAWSSSTARYLTT